MKIDPSRSWAAVEERLAATENLRHRLLLQVLLDHLEAEATKDFDRLLSTLSDDPQYHFWIPDAGFGRRSQGLRRGDRPLHPALRRGPQCRPVRH